MHLDPFLFLFILSLSYEQTPTDNATVVPTVQPSTIPEQAGKKNSLSIFLQISVFTSKLIILVGLSCFFVFVYFFLIYRSGKQYQFFGFDQQPVT